MNGSKPMLRVLSGRLTGSTIVLEPDRPVTIGHAFTNEVVLRDASTAELSLRLCLQPCGSAEVELLGGSVELLGNTVSAPGRVVLPAYVPLHAGAFALAHGLPLSPRWSEAEALMPEAAATPPVVEESSDAPGLVRAVAARLGAARAQLTSRTTLLGGGMVLSLLIAGPPAFERAMHSAPNPVEARAVLASAGYPGLEVAMRASGEVQVSGLVATEYDRGRVAEVLAAAGLPAMLDLATGEAMAVAAADVFRANGVAASGRFRGQGVVELTTPPLPADLRQRLTQLAMRDVAGLARVDVRHRGERPAAGLPAPRTVDEAMKRVATVVAGEPGYVVTADGARYFPGAMLPTGHRLVAVEEAALKLERAGRITRLAF